MDPSMTFDATMIANSPEIQKMFLAAALKQESALVIKYKYDILFLKRKEKSKLSLLRLGMRHTGMFEFSLALSQFHLLYKRK